MLIGVLVALGLSLAGNVALLFLVREQSAFIRELQAAREREKQPRYDPFGEYGPPTWNPFKQK